MSDGENELTEIEGEIIKVDNNQALMALNRSEIDQQITTAKKYPRSLSKFKKKALERACLDEETAVTMFYSLPRAGKTLQGPSVRLAEIVGSSWGNLRYGARIVEVGEEFVTAQGICHDLEENVAMAIEVKRRITNKNGTRLNDDMIQVTCAAACSIALRQAIFKVVPFALVKTIYEAARRTAMGNAESLASRRERVLAWFKKAGADSSQVLGLIGKPGTEDITLEDILLLNGTINSIRDGETTLEQVFEGVQSARAKVRKSELNDRIGTSETDPESEPPPADPAPAKKPSKRELKEAQDRARERVGTPPEDGDDPKPIEPPPGALDTDPPEQREMFRGGRGPY